MGERKYSQWIKFDLHIHSHFSNKSKTKDYKGKEYDAEKLITTLLNKNVGIFSITDHNILNVELYKGIQKYIAANKSLQNQINYLVGVELDIKDEKISKDMIHVLCIFKSKDLEIINKSINEITVEETPNIMKVFETLNRNKLYDFMLIPHFNNKHRSVKSENAVEHLNRLTFNAYEDSNNVDKLTDSLKIYLENGFQDFPFIAFSDCHNIDNYPKTNENDPEKVISSILADIKFPFNSVKTAFEEPRLRLSIDGINEMRNVKVGYQNIFVSEKGVKTNLSSYVNTIIGSFGSGKSLFLDKFENGISLTNPKYKDVIPTVDEYSIHFDGNKVNSLKEAQSSNLIKKIIKVDQFEELVYTQNINKEYIEKLSKNLDFEFPKLIDFKITDFSKEIQNTLNKLIINKLEFKKLYSFNYKLAFEVTKYYKVIDDKVYNKEEYEVIENELQNSNLSTIKELKISGIYLFNENERGIADDVINLINDKKLKVSKIKRVIKTFNEKFKRKLELYKSETNVIQSQTTKNDINQLIKQNLNEIKLLYKRFQKIENDYNSEKHNELSNLKEEEKFDNYAIVVKYNIESLEEYNSLNNHMFSQTNRKATPFLSIIDKLSEDKPFKGNKKISEAETIINKYIEVVEQKFNSSNVSFDIIKEEDDDKVSILKLSPGERAQELLKLVFNRIIKSVTEEERTFVILDQPENNLDNLNTMNLIVDKIKEIKLLDTDNYITFVIVTHNANVCITADSENIIIASHKNKVFSLKSGSIENEDHIKEVCEILEGGEQALEARSSKYNLKIKREVRKNV